MNSTFKELLSALSIVFISIIGYIIMFAIIGLISVLECDTLTKIAEYIVPIGILVYIYYLFKIKTK